jgi:hypothetical protein
MIIGGLAILMAVFMFFGYFTASWMEQKDANSGKEKVTAWELFTGKNNGEDAKLGDSGKNVRGIDRMLFLIPWLAIALGLAGFVYGFGRLVNLPFTLTPIQAAIALAILAFLLFIFPFMWQSMSNSNIRGELKDSFKDYGYSPSDSELDKAVESLSDLYSTGQQIFFGFVALLAGLAAVAIELPQVRLMLGLQSARGDPRLLLERE